MQPNLNGNVIVICKDLKDIGYFMKLYADFDSATIAKKRLNKIYLKKGGIIFFVKPKWVHHYMKKSPKAMIMHETEFLRLYL